MTKIIFRFVAYLVFIPSISFANTHNQENPHTQGVTLAASLVATLEACAPKYPQFVPYVANPQSFIQLVVRDKKEVDLMLQIMNSDDYLIALPIWRKAMTNGSSARELDSECKALSDILGHPQK